MSSPRKIDSARANSAKSTGPKTAAGKAASALNAVTHGLTAQTVVLYTESKDEFQTELDQYLAHFQPQCKPEFDLVRQLAAAHWRLCRYAGVESGLLENALEDKADSINELYESISENCRLAMAFESFAGANSALALLNRYQARLHREYQKILKALTEMQAARLAKKVKLQNEANPISEHFDAPRAAPVAPNSTQSLDQENTDPIN